MSFSETLFKLNVGVDTYGPDIVESGSLKFRRLKNVKPERDRLVCPSGYSLLQTIAGGSVIRSFAFYTIPTSLFTSLYALDNTKIYRFEFSTQLFDDSAIYNGFPDTTDAYAKVSWLDAAYVTKRGGRLVRLRDSVATEIPNAPAGRYMVIADSHLMIANTTSLGDEHPVRVQNSDLYAPESWVIGPASEADFFELSPDDGEVTGLSYQRGATLIYTRTRIWVARYLKGQAATLSSDGTLGKFQYDILFSDVGNTYHNAQISVKEVDYFIGEDNIYKIDGFQLTAVGDPIWEFFQSTIVNTNFQDSVLAIYDKSRSEVAWIYDHVTEGRWSIVYNYKENKWSDRDAQDIYSSINLSFPVQGYISFNDTVPDTFNDYATGHAFNGAWQYLDTVIGRLLGGSAGKIYIPSSPATYVKADNTAFSCEIESYEFDFDSLDIVKEMDRLKLLFSSRSGDDVADSDLAISIGIRPNRTQDVVWSTPVPLTDMLVEDTVFTFRNKGQAHLIRFKFTWTNNVDFAITELVKLGFFKLEQGTDESPPK